MYTVSQGPSKIVAKTRRGLTQNYEKFETIKESGKRSEKNSPENMHIPRPVFQTVKKVAPAEAEQAIISPQHEEIINYINESWNIIVAQNPYDQEANGTPDLNHNYQNGTLSMSASTSTASSAPASPTPPMSPTPSTSPLYCVEPPSPVLSDFQPFDLESWWGRRLFNNITKSL